MNSTPSRAALIMLLTAFPPAPPTPITVIRGLISDSFWGRLRLIVIRLLHANEGVICSEQRRGPISWPDPSPPPAFLTSYLEPVGIDFPHTTYCLKVFPNPTANPPDSTRWR